MKLREAIAERLGVPAGGAVFADGVGRSIPLAAAAAGGVMSAEAAIEYARDGGSVRQYPLTLDTLLEGLPVA